MRLRLRLPEIREDEYVVPQECPYGCGGRYFALHQECPKAVSDPEYAEVKVKRYRCVQCGHSFRVYPQGVSHRPRSQRLRGIGVMLYALGLSYGGVADALRAFGWQGSKSSVYRDVQAAGEAVGRLRVNGLRRRVQVVSADTTYVVCNREEITVAVAVDALAGDVLEVELVDSESAESLRAFLTQLQEQYDMEVLVSDDQDSYKVLADELGLRHSICRAHVNRNVAKLVGDLATEALAMPSQSPVPRNVHSSLDQLLTDLEYVQLLIALRPLDGDQQLSDIHRRYQAAPPPAKGEKASIWYWFRFALLRWWNNWDRLTQDLHWNRNHESQLDGTNNAAERAIGWWIKERYRTMRTYKRTASVRNLSRLIPYLAARADQPELARLLAS
jgi:transposase-like protein